MIACCRFSNNSENAGPGWSNFFAGHFRDAAAEAGLKSLRRLAEDRIKTDLEAEEGTGPGDRIVAVDGDVNYDYYMRHAMSVDQDMPHGTIVQYDTEGSPVGFFVRVAPGAC